MGRGALVSSVPWTTTPGTYETATHANGPKVYDWLSERGHLESLVLRGSAVDRTMRCWRSGRCPSFDSLDRILLNAFDVYVRELPDDVWLIRTRERVAA